MHWCGSMHCVLNKIGTCFYTMHWCTSTSAHCKTKKRNVSGSNTTLITYFVAAKQLIMRKNLMRKKSMRKKNVAKLLLGLLLSPNFLIKNYRVVRQSSCRLYKWATVLINLRYLNPPTRQLDAPRRLPSVYTTFLQLSYALQPMY